MFYRYDKAKRWKVDDEENEKGRKKDRNKYSLYKLWDKNYMYWDNVKKNPEKK